MAYPYPPPENTPEDYLTQFQQLLPRGRVWHRGWGWVQDADLLTLMPTWSRLQSKLNNLIAQIFPCSTAELLPEWEETLGLPDPCIGPLATLQQRQFAVCAKFVARGGQTKEYFIHLAAALGFEIQIQTFIPFSTGISHAGDHLYSEEWAFAWRVIVYGSVPIIYFRTGESTAGEPLAIWDIGVLQCLFEEYKPAHTTIIFSFRLNSSIWDSGNSIWDDGDSIWDTGTIVTPPDQGGTMRHAFAN